MNINAIKSQILSMDNSQLKEIAEIKRKNNPVWGVG